MVRPALDFDTASLRLAYADGVRLDLDAEWLRDAVGDGVAAGEAQRRFDPAGLSAPAGSARATLADDETLVVTFAAEAAVLILGLRLIPLAPARPYVDVFARWLRRTKQKISMLNQ